MMPQHLGALEHANANRLRKAQLRRDVAAGRVTVAAALADPALAAAAVADVLAWQHRWGRFKAEQFLRRYEICTPYQTVGHLTERQRVLIARCLRTGEQVAA